MLLTTLCYIEKENQYLMLHRISKKKDVNAGKWIGVGGKFLPGETPDECLLREVKEETGLTLTKYCMRGVVTFISQGWESECMFLYTAGGFEGELAECSEGVLKWVPVDQILSLPLWEGDRIFLKQLWERDTFFTMKVRYQGEHLEEWYLKEHSLEK